MSHFFIHCNNISFKVFSKPWPGIMRTVWGNQERFESTYFKSSTVTTAQETVRGVGCGSVVIQRTNLTDHLFSCLRDIYIYIYM